MDASNAAIWFSSVIPCLGVFSVVFARLCPEGAARRASHFCMFAAMLVVAAMTALTVAAGSGHWLSHGTTFSIMAIGSILDLSREGAVRLP